jgi:plastocyanin
VAALDIIALSIAFDTDCLVAPASEKFTINFDNQDDGVLHNLDVFTEQGGDSLASTDPKTGPAKEPLNVDPLDEGTYYFQCDVHPTTMFGALAVVKGAK